MNEVTVLFDYKASGGKIKGLEKFENSLKQEYLISLRPNRLPQAGGLWDIVVQLYLNTTLSEFVLNAVAGGLLWDLVSIGSRKFFIRPLTNALKKLQEENEHLDYWPVLTITFDDVQLKFYGFNANFLAAVSHAFNVIFKNYEKILNLSDKELFAIHIPAYLNTEVIDRVVYVVDSHCEPTDTDFTGYWALSYNVDHDRDVLDVTNMVLLDKDWEERGHIFRSR